MIYLNYEDVIRCIVGSSAQPESKVVILEEITELTTWCAEPNEVMVECEVVTERSE